MPQRHPRDYTPNHLADKILQSKSALEGERKQVTVLFADVKGSLELAEQVDPEEWHQILDRFFQILADGVHRFEGTVNQYTGDGIMALFGAPIAHEDHAQRACYAALHLRDELRGYGDELRLDRGISFAVRMGVNSGEVIVGKIGNDLRMDYTAQGHTVGLAARMQQIAEPGKVYLTQHAARLVEGFFQLRDLGQPRVKGVAESLRVCELEGAGPSRTRLDVARRRGFSRFVGRADEMATLELALHRAAEGDGQVVGVVGEAGVGKSRLCLEFVERCSAKGVSVNQAHCPAHGKAVPLLPVLELLRNVFSISEQDNDQVAREKIAGRLVLLDREFEEVLPLVFDFLDVPDPESPAPPIDPEARQRRLFDFVRRLVQKASEREPTVLLVDDLHWIDAGSDAFLAQTVEAVSGTRTMLLVNFRPEYQAEWVAKSHFHQLPLAPLGGEAIGELLDELLGNDPSLGTLRERIRERTEGNPFFIEEVLESLIESERVEGTRGHYRLVGELDQIEIPTTVQSVLAARIDRLGEREKRVLQLCAVIGEDLQDSLIERIAEFAKPELAGALQSLVGAEFLYERALYPVLEYGFKHALTREVAYESQLRGRRECVHGVVAKALEELHADALDEKAALLARHWEQAGKNLEAARCHARAAGWVVRGDQEAARSHWLHVRRLLAQLEDSPEKLGLDLMACGQLTMQSWALGAPAEKIEALFAEGKALAERIPDLAPRSLLQIGHAIFVGLSGGDATRYVSTAREAVRLAEASGDPHYRLAARVSLATALDFSGNPAESLELLEQCVAARPEDPLAGRGIAGSSPWLLAVITRFRPLGQLGRLGEAGDAIRQGIELAREHGEFEILSYGLGLRAVHGEWTGETETTLVSVRQGVEIAKRSGIPFWLSFALAYLGDALRLEQHYSEALEAYEKALDLMRSKRVALMWEPLVVSGQALVDSALGEHERAIVQARSALEESVRGGNRDAEEVARLTLARALLAVGDPGLQDEIESTVERAETLCQETGMRVHLPALLELRAALAARREDPQEARRRLFEAHRLYTEMDATGHARRLAEELEL